jgi:hypothetical protein
MWSGFRYVAVGARKDVDQGPDRAISLETEKSVPKTRDASPDAHLAAIRAISTSPYHNFSESETHGRREHGPFCGATCDILTIS